MDGKSVGDALVWLCAVLDGGRPVGSVPRALLRCGLPAALGVAACGGGHPPPADPTDDRSAVAADAAVEERAEGEAPGASGRVELVLDGIDNDGDGLVDCGDPDCAAMRVCLAGDLKEDVPLYGVRTIPPERLTPIPCEAPPAGSPPPGDH